MLLARHANHPTPCSRRKTVFSSFPANRAARDVPSAQSRLVSKRKWAREARTRQASWSVYDYVYAMCMLASRFSSDRCECSCVVYHVCLPYIYPSIFHPIPLSVASLALIRNICIISNIDACTHHKLFSTLYALAP